MRKRASFQTLTVPPDDASIVDNAKGVINRAAVRPGPSWGRVVKPASSKRQPASAVWLPPETATHQLDPRPSEQTSPDRSPHSDRRRLLRCFSEGAG